jgi:E3 ubiquitin-protein ligase RNF14
MEDNGDDERAEELSSISAIFPELVVDPLNPFLASIDLPVAPTIPLPVTFSVTGASAVPTSQPRNPQNEHREFQDHLLSYLPPLHLKVTLPEGYPATKPPEVALSTDPPWLPWTVIDRLQKEVEGLWEELGHGQMVYAYIDFLQQSAEDGFDLGTNTSVGLKIDQEMRAKLVGYDAHAKLEKFEKETFDCGICLEPKKGSSCYKLSRCGHVFCRACLRDFYNNAIAEGDVDSVKCLAPDCEEQNKKQRKKSGQTLPPGELLLIPLERSTVQRYVDLKRKKQLESDKSTIYCPRQWCQSPARTKKYPKVTDLSRMESWETSDTETISEPVAAPINPTNSKAPTVRERLAICEDCDYAFCRVCLSGWHGEFVRCWPRTATEVSEEEQKSYDYIRLNTSPCPSCSSPIQKTLGCNHMRCYQCGTHFCYLCSSWLNPDNPYAHFNQSNTACYQRLWVLEEGDEGAGGVHFDGPRGAEALAIAAAQEEDANAAGHGGAANGQGRVGQVDRPEDPLDLVRLAVGDIDFGVAQLQVNDEGDEVQHPQLPRFQPRPAGQPHRPHHPANPDQGNRVRHHVEERRRGLENFLRQAANDQEDEWDSDELDEEGDDAWEIQER